MNWWICFYLYKYAPATVTSSTFLESVHTMHTNEKYSTFFNFLNLNRTHTWQNCPALHATLLRPWKISLIHNERLESYFAIVNTQDRHKLHKYYFRNRVARNLFPYYLNLKVPASDGYTFVCFEHHALGIKIYKIFTVPFANNSWIHIFGVIDSTAFNRFLKAYES